MHHLLIYISKESHPLDESYMVNLLKKARKNNSDQNITGMLLYKEGEFMQALEGDKNSVLSLYETIEKDYHHKNLVVLTNKDIVERSFDEWSMGYRALEDSEIRNIEGFNNVLETSFFSEDFKHSETAYNLLSMFSKKQTPLID